jgi:hypothetical protein
MSIRREGKISLPLILILIALAWLVYSIFSDQQSHKKKEPKPAMRIIQLASAHSVEDPFFQATIMRRNSVRF